MGNKSEREQFRTDAATQKVANSSKLTEILDGILLVKDLMDLITAQVRVVSGDGTEQDLLTAKQRKLGLDGRLEELRLKFQKDIGLERVEAKEVDETNEVVVDTNQSRRV